MRPTRISVQTAINARDGFLGRRGPNLKIAHVIANAIKLRIDPAQHHRRPHMSVSLPCRWTNAISKPPFANSSSTRCRIWSAPSRAHNSSHRAGVGADRALFSGIGMHLSRRRDHNQPHLHYPNQMNDWYSKQGEGKSRHYKERRTSYNKEHEFFKSCIVR